MSCPVIRAMDDIRGAGIYKDFSEDTDFRVVKIGGHDVVYDEVNFYITSRRIELARFEFSNPTIEVAQQKFKTMFGQIIGLTYSRLFTLLISKLHGRKFVYTCFVSLIDLLGSLEELIQEKIKTTKKNINVSLPDIMLPPDVGSVLAYRWDIMQTVTNKLVDYINKLNINSLVKTHINIRLTKLDMFEGTTPDMQKIIGVDLPPADTVEGIIANMKSVLNQEEDVSRYIAELEIYQCKAISILNKIHNICDQLVANLS